MHQMTFGARPQNRGILPKLCRHLGFIYDCPVNYMTCNPNLITNGLVTHHRTYPVTTNERISCVPVTMLVSCCNTFLILANGANLSGGFKTNFWVLLHLLKNG